MAASRHTDTEHSSGRPRDPQLSASIIDATLQILDHQGYSHVTFEAVSRLAHTSRPAIYRRWPSRAAMTLDAIATRLEIPEQPDTGCTLCDIDESLQVFLAAYRTIQPDALIALYADCATDETLRQQYLDTILEPARTAVDHTLQRATERGDLRADVDQHLLLDLVGALVHYRAMFNPRHLSELEAAATIDILLQGAAANYPELVERSANLPADHHHVSHEKLTPGHDITPWPRGESF